MKVLVTGGCGFLGSAVASRLISEGRDTIVFDDLSRVGTDDNRRWLESLGTFVFRHGDVRNANDVERTVREHRPDVVFHLAGQVAMTTSMSDPRRDFEINVLGVVNMLEALRRERPGATIVYSSSNKVYGDLENVRYEERPTRWVVPAHPDGFDEATPLDFRTPYGCSKGAAEQYVLEYARSFGIHGVVFRHSTIFGARQRSTYDQGWVGWFVMEAVKRARGDRSPLTISGDGKQVRDVLYVDDAVDAYLAAAARPDVASGHAFNIGGGMQNSLSLRELFAELEQRLGVALDVAAGPWRSSDQKVFVADHAKVTRLLGWRPKVSRDEGIAKVVARWAEPS